jgi:hypothetical protein
MVEGETEVGAEVVGAAVDGELDGDAVVVGVEVAFGARVIEAVWFQSIFPRPVGVTGTTITSRGACPADDEENVNEASSIADQVLLLLSYARTRTSTFTEPLVDARVRRRFSSPNTRFCVDAPNVKRTRRAVLLGVESNSAGSLPSTVT